MVKEPFKIPSFSVVTIFICITLMGLALLPLLPYRSKATAELPKVNVRFKTRSHLTPRIVENEITNKLEQTLSRTENVTSVSSTSNSEYGEVRLELADGTDMQKAKFDIATNINNVWDQISPVALYPEIHVVTAERGRHAFMRYSVSANQPVDRLTKYAERNIIPKISLVDGVGSLGYSKAADNQYLLRYDQQVLDNMGIESGQIVSAINQGSVKSLLGLVPCADADNGVRMLRLSLQSSVSDLKKLTVVSRDGKRIPLSSLAEIIPVDNNNDSNTRINGQNTILIDITAKENANEMAVSKDVRKIVDEIRQDAPDGFSIQLQDDSSEKVASEIQNIVVRSAMTILILVLFLFVSTRNTKVVLSTISSLVAALLISVIGYYLFHVEMNMYALAGITISLSLMIDNSIVMANQILRENNINVFQPMLAATLTTIGALSIVFFLDTTQRITLESFTIVIIINLTVSLFTATFFVPTMMDKMNIPRQERRLRTSSKRAHIAIAFNRHYERAIVFLSRHRIATLAALVLSFGLPVYLLPISLRGDSKAEKLYNMTIGSDYYNEKMRPNVNKLLGGSLYRLHKTIPKIEEYEKKDHDIPVITIGATLPPGGTADMMNIPIKKMENIVGDLPGIKKILTNINGTESAYIYIYFHKDAIRQGLPNNAKNKIIDTALSISGIAWTVAGPGNAQFANTTTQVAGEYEMTLKGYNYDELNRYAGLLRDSLESEKRVRDVTISSQGMLWIQNYSEFDLKLSPTALDRHSLTVTDVNRGISERLGGGNIMQVDENGETRELQLQTTQYAYDDLWNLTNKPININGTSIKLADMASVKKHVVPMDIYKADQQYQLYVQFNYKGSVSAAYGMIDKKLESFSKMLPMGFSINDTSKYKNTGKNGISAALILVIIAIVFVTASVLLNSLKQPFAIIMVIPVSFIGMFLAFHSLRVPFNDGGMAALVLLCGQTVNASIYLTYEYNVIRKRHAALSCQRAFVKSWNRKITPICLTIISTILGFLPFVIGNNAENEFWHSLSIGTIAGLATSLLGVFVFLPAFLVSRKSNKATSQDNHY